jgi:hypothetical protein
MRRLLFKLTTIFFIALVTTGCTSKRFIVLDSATDLPIVGAYAHVTQYGTAPGFGHPTSITVLDRNYQTDQHGEFSVLAPGVKGSDVSLSKQGYVQIQTVKELRRNQEKEAALIYLYLTPKSDMTVETINYLVATEEIRRANKMFRTDYSNIAREYGFAKNLAKSENELLAVKSFCRFAHLMKLEFEKDPLNFDRHFDRNFGDELRFAHELIRDCHEAQ